MMVVKLVKLGMKPIKLFPDPRAGGKGVAIAAMEYSHGKYSILITEPLEGIAISDP
jgi:hypothetical protein